jgi:hypothetical protein
MEAGSGSVAQTAEYKALNKTPQKKDPFGKTGKDKTNIKKAVL